jgi:TRAP-type C4-dicarboxylate transport system permease small subunit
VINALIEFHRRLATIIGLLIIALVVVIVVDATGRFLLNKPLPGSVEMSRIALAWILFLSLAYGQIQGVHVRVEIFFSRYSPRLRRTAGTLTALISMLFFGFLTYAGWDMFQESYNVSETIPAPIWLPYWLPKLAMPIGFALLVLQLGIEAVLFAAGKNPGNA